MKIFSCILSIPFLIKVNFCKNFARNNQRTVSKNRIDEFAVSGFNINYPWLYLDSHSTMSVHIGLSMSVEKKFSITNLLLSLYCKLKEHLTNWYYFVKYFAEYFLSFFNGNMSPSKNAFFVKFSNSNDVFQRPWRSLPPSICQKIIGNCTLKQQIMSILQ